jgi:hypothetical protein
MKLLLRLLVLTSSATVSFGFAPTTSFQRNPLTVSTNTANELPRGKATSLSLSPVEAWDSYNAALEADPLVVKSITASVILGAADFAGQAFERSRKDDDAPEVGIDYARAARFAVFGLVLQAPWNHFYYNLLDGQIPPTAEPFTVTNFEKVAIDQFIQAPIFTVLIFVFLGLLEGKAVDDIQSQLKNDYKPTLLANWKLWVPATMINIGFVPPLLRVLYLNCVFFFWSIYLSLILNKKEEP